MAKTPRYNIDMLRANAQTRLETTDSTMLWPVLPKLIIMLCETVLELYEENEALKK